jgi:hypothetical protein
MYFACSQSSFLSVSYENYTETEIASGKQEISLQKYAA